MLHFNNPRTAETLMRDNLIVKHRAGSHAYGTNIHTSDEDFRGIFCADPVNLLTPFFPIRESSDVSEEDTKFYELSHFMGLYTGCNPNIVETLWVDPIDVVYTTPTYEYLRSVRGELLSSKVAFTFTGYAVAQLKRIKGHNKWINNPQPIAAPLPRQFLTVVQWFGTDKNLHVDLTKFRDNHRFYPYGNNIYAVFPEIGYQLWDEYGNLNVLNSDERLSHDNVPLILVKWNKEEYKLAKEKHINYWNWKNNRNETRSELEEHFGYDTKHAMHLVRLMRMGREILKTGEVVVKRPDADELLSIRSGAWTYQQVLDFAESMDKEIREELYHKTSLPKYPNLKRAAEITITALNMMWEK